MLKALRVQKVVPVAITHNDMINACSKGTQPELALEVFEAVAVQKVVSDAITYNAVINACSKGKQPELAH